MGSEVVQAAASTLTYVLLARSLGPSSFGLVAGVTAMVSVVVPLSSLGAGNLLVYEVAKRSSLSDAWSQAFTRVLAGAVAGCMVAVGMGVGLLPNVSVVLITVLAVAELCVIALTRALVQAFQAVDRLRDCAFGTSLMSVAKAVAAVAVFGSATPTPQTWAIAQLLACSVGCAVFFSFARASLGIRGPALLPVSRLFRGLPFALSAAAMEIQDDIDKTLLVRYGHDVDAGMYAVAYRAATIPFLPVKAVMFALYTRFFREGSQGVRAGLRLAKRAMLPGCLYASAASAAMFIAAPWVAALVGPEFGDTASAVRWLVAVPVIRVPQYLLGDVLAGCGAVRLRASMQLGSAVLMVVLAVALIPQYSWRGAVASTIMVEIGLAAVYWLALTRLRADQA